MSDSGDGRNREPHPLPSFLAEGLAGRRAGARIDLSEDEAAHIRAARIRPGSRLAVTDGGGRRWEGEMAGLDRRGAHCRLLRALPARPPPPLGVWIPVANRDRSLWLVEKVVELGVSAVTWIEWDRSRSVGDAGRSAGFRERAARRARAALKQSGGSWLPRLLGPAPLEEALTGREGTGWLADAGGARLFADGVARAVVRARAGNLLTVAVGPEGGITTEERRRCRAAGFELISRGPGTLRFETAAVAAVAIAAAILEDAEGTI